MSAKIVYDRLRDQLERTLSKTSAQANSTSELADKLGLVGSNRTKRVSDLCRTLQRFGAAACRPGRGQENLWWDPRGRPTSSTTMRDIDRKMPETAAPMSTLLRIFSDRSESNLRRDLVAMETLGLVVREPISQKGKKNAMRTVGWRKTKRL